MNKLKTIAAYVVILAVVVGVIARAQERTGPNAGGGGVASISGQIGLPQTLTGSARQLNVGWPVYATGAQLPECANTAFSTLQFGPVTNVMSRMEYRAQMDINGIALVAGNPQTRTVKCQLAPGPTNIVVKMSVEDANGNIFPITWNGNTTTNVTQWTHAQSDTQNSFKVLKGQNFFVRSWVVLGSANPAYGFDLTGLTGGHGFVDGALYGTFATDLTASGTIPPLADTGAYAPEAILTGVPGTSQSIIIFGDSIVSDQADPIEPLPNNQSPPIVLGCSNTIALLNVAGGNETVQVEATNFISFGLAKYASIAVCNLGVNDEAGDPPFATLSNAYITLWSNLYCRGLPVYQMTILPHTGSSDGWTTTNQTSLHPNLQTNLNNWFRSKPSPYLAGVIDINKYVTPAGNELVWFPGYTLDGLHPVSTNGAAAWRRGWTAEFLNKLPVPGPFPATSNNFGAFMPDGNTITVNPITGKASAVAAGTGTMTSLTFTGDGTVLSSTPSAAVTTSGTVAATLANAAATTYLGNPTTSSAQPGYTANGIGWTNLMQSAWTNMSATGSVTNYIPNVSGAPNVCISAAADVCLTAVTNGPGKCLLQILPSGANRNFVFPTAWHMFGNTNNFIITPKGTNNLIVMTNGLEFDALVGPSTLTINPDGAHTTIRFGGSWN